MKYYLIISMLAIFLLILLPSISATCTISLNNANYSQQSTATVTTICSNNNEENRAYTFNWTNGSGFQLELDTGTTPEIDNNFFFETYVIPSNYFDVYGNNLSVTLTGTNLEGSDSSEVNNGSATALIIKDGSLSSNILLGRVSSFGFNLVDENDKKVNNALCTAYIEDGNNLPVTSEITGIYTIDGIGVMSKIFKSKDNIVEGNQYLGVIECSCGSSGTERECFDEDGTAITNSYGMIEVPFTVDTWAEVNTVTEFQDYNSKDLLFICANVTNKRPDERIQLEIHNSARCSAGNDNDQDRDRILIVSDEGSPDSRGVNSNTTQMQCKRFIIPEIKRFEGKVNECYASTEVWIVGDDGERITRYPTTSNRFNVTSDELNLWADWEHISDNKFFTIINLSDNKYSKDYDGSGIGNIDIRLDVNTDEIAQNQQRAFPEVDFSLFLSTQYIKSYSATYLNGSSINTNLEFLEDGNLELELKDVNLSQGNWYKALHIKSF